MAYVRATLAGVGAALLGCLLWIVAVFVLPLVVQTSTSLLSDGSGAAYASFSTGPLAAIALVAFVAGFVLSLRRGGRRRH